MRGTWGLRGAALLAVGALSLHELRYWLSDGTIVVGGHGHSYMPLAVGLVTVLLLLACASFTRTLLHALRGVEDDRTPPPFRALWPVLSAALLSVFFLQEWIEGWVTPGHPATLSHAIAHMGWVTPALAIALGCLIAVLIHGSRGAIDLVARRHRARRPGPRARRGTWAPLPSVEAPRLSVLAANRAGRAPPGASFT
jgi:hypothetical protein